MIGKNMENKEELKGWTIPVLDQHGYVRLVDWLGDDARILEAARVSYKSTSKGEEQDKKLLAYLWKNKHLSPFEQCSVVFDIKLPLFVQAQMVRHRTQKINQVSARYTELPNEFYIPTTWRKQSKDNKQGSVVDEEWCDNTHAVYSDCFRAQCDQAYKRYQAMIKEGIAREMARMVLPQNIYTEIYSCWDLRNLLNFIALRDDSHAQAEIQEYSKAIKTMLEKLFPWTMACYHMYKWKVVDCYDNVIY
jgi:thymidylate synthase (FAD)